VHSDKRDLVWQGRHLMGGWPRELTVAFGGRVAPSILAF